MGNVVRHLFRKKGAPELVRLDGSIPAAEQSELVEFGPQWKIGVCQAQIAGECAFGWNRGKKHQPAQPLESDGQLRDQSTEGVADQHRFGSYRPYCRARVGKVVGEAGVAQQRTSAASPVSPKAQRMSGEALRRKKGEDMFRPYPC